MEWEASLIEWLQAHLGSAGIALAKIFSLIGGETGLLLGLMILLFCYRKEAGKRVGLSLSAAIVWFPMIKSIALRPRPYFKYPDRIDALLPVDSGAAMHDVAAQGYSFPSGHSACVLAIYGALARIVRKKGVWIAVIALAALVGLSRFAVGMHYPTDVLAGWALGLVTIQIGALLEKKIRQEWLRYLILLATALPGFFFVDTNDYYSAVGLLIGMILVIPYEKKYVDFQDTRNPWAMILRVAGAFALYLALNTALKLPFSPEFLAGGSTAAHLIRCARYAVLLFVIVGVYPRLFPLFEKVGQKPARS